MRFVSGSVAKSICVSILTIPAIVLAAPAAQPSGGSDLHQRAVAALPDVRSALDDVLSDYPSARFRDVHARLVRSVYDDDEGQSNKVPWTHRGSVVLVMCGEINAKNRMGGYIGWQPFSFEPSQTDIVNMYDAGTPRRLQQVNLAKKPKFWTFDDNIYGEDAQLLCGPDAEAIDAADLADSMAFQKA